MKKQNKINLVKKDSKSNLWIMTEKKIQRVLNEIFSKSSFTLKNKPVFVNVLTVDLSKDFKNAKILLDSFGVSETKKTELLKEFNSIGFIKQIKNLIAQNMKLRYIPEIRFYLDIFNEKAERVNKIIDQEIKKLEFNDGN